MDPTAVFAAAAAFFNFASSPVGQQILEDIRKLNGTINADIAKLIATTADHAPTKA